MKRQFAIRRNRRLIVRLPVRRDPGLLTAARAGDAAAFCQLYIRHVNTY